MAVSHLFPNRQFNKDGSVINFQLCRDLLFKAKLMTDPILAIQEMRQCHIFIYISRLSLA